MPDFTYESFAQCETVEHWETKVKGSKGDIYTVYTTNSPKNSGGLACTCKGFQIRSHCSHIEKVEKQRCAWMEFIDGEQPTEDGKCPKCNSGVVYRSWAI